MAKQTLGHVGPKKPASGKKAVAASQHPIVTNTMIQVMKEGGNAVINIKSYYKKNEVSSAGEYECGAGAMVSGVAFKGEVVKLAK